MVPLFFWVMKKTIDAIIDKPVNFSHLFMPGAFVQKAAGDTEAERERETIENRTRKQKIFPHLIGSQRSTISSSSPSSLARSTRRYTSFTNQFHRLDLIGFKNKGETTMKMLTRATTIIQRPLKSINQSRSFYLISFLVAYFIFIFSFSFVVFSASLLRSNPIKDVPISMQVLYWWYDDALLSFAWHLLGNADRNIKIREKLRALCKPIKRTCWWLTS